MVQNIFPPLSKEEILKHVKENWDLSGDFPLPQFTVHCPVCGSEEVQLQFVSFHPSREPDTSRVPYRCVVGFKCTRCSAMWAHGIAIPEEMYRKHIPLGAEKQDSKSYTWREVKKILEQAKG